MNVISAFSQDQWYDDNVTNENIFDVKQHKYWIGRPWMHFAGVFATEESAVKALDEWLAHHANVVGVGQWRVGSYRGIEYLDGKRVPSSKIRDVIWIDHLTGEFASYWQSVTVEEVK